MPTRRIAQIVLLALVAVCLAAWAWKTFGSGPAAPADAAPADAAAAPLRDGVVVYGLHRTQR